MENKCPFCHGLFSASQEVVVCPTCQTPHHKECWDENGGCTIYGCASSPPDEPKTTIPSPPPDFKPFQRASGGGLEAWLRTGFALYRNNFWLLTLAAFLVACLSVLSVGILAGPLCVAFCQLLLNVSRLGTEKPDIAALFSFKGIFIEPLAGMIIYLAVAFSFGKLVSLADNEVLSIISSLLLATTALFWPFVIAESHADFWTSWKRGVSLLRKKPLSLIGLITTYAAINALGALPCGIGLLFSIPASTCMLTAAYVDLSSRKGNR